MYFIWTIVFIICAMEAGFWAFDKLQESVEKDYAELQQNINESREY